MSRDNGPHFKGGRNIAMKIPQHLFDKTVAFYRDTLSLPVVEEGASTVVFEFGTNRLWLDRTDYLSQAEIWLEITTDDVPSAKSYFASTNTIRKDEIEALPDGFEGFWISNPAKVIHLVSRK
ncbi:MAG: hypothetical protein GTN81_14105 [Proteobacteria bacterium]|nr:hypothetical protein [Pseudomonadota bacterium]